MSRPSVTNRTLQLDIYKICGTCRVILHVFFSIVKSRDFCGMISPCKLYDMLEMSQHTTMLMCHGTHCDGDMIYYRTILVYQCQYCPTA